MSGGKGCGEEEEGDERVERDEMGSSSEITREGDEEKARNGEEESDELDRDLFR